MFTAFKVSFPPKRLLLISFCLGFLGFICHTQTGEVQLLVRADDMGFSHSANLACVEVFENGIARSVEIIVPAPWFPEAIKMLQDYPGYDVGVHLALTSEWENMRWGPVSHAPSLVDKDGYFYPTFWAGQNFSEEETLTHNQWKAEEVEQELRAQIEKAMRYIPNISHVSFHMGGSQAHPRFGEIYQKLLEEYKLVGSLDAYGVQRFNGFNGARTAEDKINNLIKALEELKPGKYLFVEHPGFDSPELRAIHHHGYADVAVDRDGVTKAWTDDSVKATIKKRGIQLVSYADIIAN